LRNNAAARSIVIGGEEAYSVSAGRPAVKADPKNGNRISAMIPAGGNSEQVELMIMTAEGNHRVPAGFRFPQSWWPVIWRKCPRSDFGWSKVSNSFLCHLRCLHSVLRKWRYSGELDRKYISRRSARSFFYAAFELASIVLLRNWRWAVMVPDVAWRATLTAPAASVGGLLASWILNKI
jgi:hypothetical protein